MLQQSKREQESATMKNGAEETMGINTTKRKMEEGGGQGRAMFFQSY